MLWKNGEYNRLLMVVSKKTLQKILKSGRDTGKDMWGPRERERVYQKDSTSLCPSHLSKYQIVGYLPDWLCREYSREKRERIILLIWENGFLLFFCIRYFKTAESYFLTKSSNCDTIIEKKEKKAKMCCFLITNSIVSWDLLLWDLRSELLYWFLTILSRRQ